MPTWTMAMTTAASPGNLVPKFSEPKTAPGPAGTIAHRASVLQNATGDLAAGYCGTGAHCVVGAVARTPVPAPTDPTAPRRATTRASLDFIRPTLGSRSQRGIVS